MTKCDGRTNWPIRNGSVVAFAHQRQRFLSNSCGMWAVETAQNSKSEQLQFSSFVHQGFRFLRLLWFRMLFSTFIILVQHCTAACNYCSLAFTSVFVISLMLCHVFLVCLRRESDAPSKGSWLHDARSIKVKPFPSCTDAVNTSII